MVILSIGTRKPDCSGQHYSTNIKLNGLGLLRANSSSNVWNVNNDGNLNNNNPSNTNGFRP